MSQPPKKPDAAESMPAPVTPAAVSELLAEAMVDKAFRERLFQDPGAELRKRGFADNPHAIGLLKKLGEGKFQDAAGATKAKSRHHPLEEGEGEG